MKKLTTLIIVLLLSVSVVAAQDFTSTWGAAAPKDPAKTEPAKPPAAGTPATAPTTPGAAPQTTFYVYTGSGTQQAVSTVPPEKFTANPPAGWNKDDISTSYAFSVPTTAAASVQQQINARQSAPTAVYDGRAVYETETGDKTIIDSSGKTYSYSDGYYDAGNVGSPTGSDIYVRVNQEGDVSYWKVEDGEYVEVDANELDESTRADADALANSDETKRAQKLAADESDRTTRSIGDFVVYFRMFSGLSGYSSLIFDEEFLEEWRSTVNDVMCNKLKIGGKDCWVSRICGKYTDITPSRAGVLYSSAVGGAPPAVAHVEGRRSFPIETPNQTYYGYTVTYSLQNPDKDDPMTYNVAFRGPQKSANWWQTPPSITPGGRASGIGAAALYKISPTLYTEVCLTFNPDIRSFDGKKISKICNDIVGYGGGATAPYSAAEPANETAAAGTAAPTSPSAPGGNV